MKVLRDGGEFITSWSGGKDSCLAHYKALSEGGVPRSLFTMMMESGDRSHSHGLSLPVLEAQAAALGLPIKVCSATWETYEERFLDLIKGFNREGVEDAVFGDIDIDDHLKWVVTVCGKAGINAHEPLWQRGREELLDEFIGLGFEAIIVAVCDAKLGHGFLGRTLTQECVADLKAAGVDACGENGEYHTIVVNGPTFRNPVKVNTGRQISRSGYSFIDIKIA